MHEIEKNEPIYVTRPSLPPLSEFIPYLEKIWDNQVLTNGGPFHTELEKALCEYLGVPYVSLFNNGTIALIIALKALGLTGEVITTPYSFVATAHSILWNGLTPVFVDIDPDTLNIDPKKVEEAITDQTSAILAVHCYGCPCDVDSLDFIAKKHQIKLIYDAAHAFGVKDRTGSILNYGDLSVLSFHATKVFNTFEGGAIVCHSLDMKKKIDSLRNFGFLGEVSISDVGMNGKLNEVSAAFGLLQLQYIDTAVLKRKKIAERYRDGLKNVKGIRVLDDAVDVFLNYSYFPILITAESILTRDELYEQFKQEGIFVRKYFYPLISDLYVSRQVMATHFSIAKKISEQVVCLPIFSDLSIFDQNRVIQIIQWNLSE